MRIGIIVRNNIVKIILLVTLFAASILVLVGCGNIKDQGVFNGQRAYQDVIQQVAIGARYPGSQGHQEILNYLDSELRRAGWDVDQHVAVIQTKQVVNLVASRDDDPQYILLGAHYDNRIYADQDPEEALRTEFVPGANDGGSGVAVLLELARTLPEDLPGSIRLVFFDAEDNGGIEDWDWCLGSRAFVRDVEPLPQIAIILDMIGDANLQVYYERNSDKLIREEIWRAADILGYGELFIKEERHSMLDDHTPFLEAGIPAVDLIDFDYPYWHTTQDTVEKVSPESLQAIGDTITAWILDQ